ncbi:hypothetical protein BDN72DRAFT_899344 [Pluteus cervinus]|uniref:Uncharacterized protein n=1 Tax=Pluteus cervinus TaxID=181527 RepID=A0ACD3AP12_9AGAR|nr:hypothetical protein BDN72DRAFT_899344 [Pluteus cervinus]
MNYNAAELRQKLDEEIAGLGRRLQTLRAQRNRLAPIYRLPIETMSHIFLSAYNGIHTRQPLTLSSVSREWRELALDLPELWSRIDGDLKLEHIPAYMARSRRKPLQVFLDNLDPNHTSTISTILREFPRMQAMAISGSPAEDLLSGSSPLWKIKAPILEKLSIERFSIRRSMFSGCVPLLSQLILTDCHFTWNSLPAFPQLKSLSIIRPQDKIALKDFLQRLHSMPLLDHVQTADALTGTLTDPSLFQLPNLTSIQLEAENCGIVAEMLQALVLPRIHRLILRLEDSDPQDQLAILDALNQRTSFVTSPVRLLNVKAREDYCGYAIEGELISAELQFNYTPPTEDDIYQFLLRFNLKNLQDLRLDFANIEEVEGDDPILWELLGESVGLQRIVVRNIPVGSLATYLSAENGKFDVLLNYLSHLFEEKWTSLPQLTELIILRPEQCSCVDAENLRAISQYLSIRQECGHELESLTVASQHPLPKALKNALRNSVGQFYLPTHDIKTDMDDLF